MPSAVTAAVILLMIATTLPDGTLTKNFMKVYFYNAQPSVIRLSEIIL